MYCNCKFVLQIAVQLATFTQCVNLLGHGNNHELYLFLSNLLSQKGSKEPITWSKWAGVFFLFCKFMCGPRINFLYYSSLSRFFYQGCILYLLRYKIIWKSNLNFIFNFAPFPNKRTKLVTDNLFVYMIQVICFIFIKIG